ncbi:hypothetical protein [Poseidonocella pacifica]|nr:hypothetical protein [Poseidonocella pacifica]
MAEGFEGARSGLLDQFTHQARTLGIARSPAQNGSVMLRVHAWSILAPA